MKMQEREIPNVSDPGSDAEAAPLSTGAEGQSTSATQENAAVSSGTDTQSPSSGTETQPPSNGTETQPQSTRTETQPQSTGQEDEEKGISDHQDVQTTSCGTAEPPTNTGIDTQITGAEIKQAEDMGETLRSEIKKKDDRLNVLQDVPTTSCGTAEPPTNTGIDTQITGGDEDIMSTSTATNNPPSSTDAVNDKQRDRAEIKQAEDMGETPRSEIRKKDDLLISQIPKAETMEADLKSEIKRKDEALKRQMQKADAMEADLKSEIKRKDEALESQIQKAETMEADFKLEIKRKDEALKSRIQKAETMEADLKSEIKRKDEALKKGTEKYNTLKEEKDIELGEQKALLENVRGKKSRLQAYIKEQTAKISTQDEVIRTLRTDKETVEKELNRFKIEAERYRTAVEATRANADSRMATLELEKKREIERMEAGFRSTKSREIAQLEENYSRHIAEILAQAQENMDSMEAEIDSRAKRIATLEKQLQEEKNEEDKLMKKIGALEKSVKVNNEEIKKTKEKLKNEETKRKAAEKQINDNTAKCRSLAGERHLILDQNAALQIEAARAREAYQRLEQYMQHVELNKDQEISRLTEQVKNLTLRLSKLASARMTTGNSAIADLSDMFRPTKIGEMFSELYDNQWTDAFEKLSQGNGKSDSDNILKMYEMLQETYKVCSTISRDHLNSMEHAMQDLRYKRTEDTRDTIGRLEIPAEALKMILDFHKTAGYNCKETIVPEVVSIVESNLNLVEREEVDAYLKGCAEVCWLMVLQDPPVVFDKLVFPQDEPTAFNKDRYRLYTKSGSHYDYIVWPALLLQEDGAILCKGVAQAK